VEHGDVVIDDGGLADHDAGGVVQHDAPADAGGRVDVHPEDLGDAGLQVEGQRPVVGDPQVVGDAAGLEGVEALEVEERLGVAGACRVPFHHGLEVRANGGADERVGGEGGVDEVTQCQRGDGGAAELVREDEAQGGLEGGVVQDGGVQEARQGRLPCGVPGGLLADAVPDLLVGNDVLHVTHPVTRGAGRLPGSAVTRTGASSPAG